MRILELIIDYIPDWVWVGLGGIIGLGLFALVMMLCDYLQVYKLK